LSIQINLCSSLSGRGARRCCGRRGLGLVVEVERVRSPGLVPVAGRLELVLGLDAVDPPGGVSLVHEQRAPLVGHDLELAVRRLRRRGLGRTV
jgi:hypothetical protein